MKRISITLAAVALAALACQQSGPTGPTNSLSNAGKVMFSNQANNGNGVVHKVSAGGADVDFSDHTDANFSLTAIQYGDGSVKGEWSDQFGQSDGGIHVAVDCLDVAANLVVISVVDRLGSARQSGKLPLDCRCWFGRREATSKASRRFAPLCSR